MEISIIDLVKAENEIVSKYNLMLKEKSMYEALRDEATNEDDSHYWKNEIVKKQQEINATKKTLQNTRKYLSDILKGYEPEWKWDFEEAN